MKPSGGARSWIPEINCSFTVTADRAASVSAYVSLISAVQTLEQTHGESKLYITKLQVQTPYIQLDCFTVQLFTGLWFFVRVMIFPVFPYQLFSSGGTEGFGRAGEGFEVETCPNSRSISGTCTCWQWSLSLCLSLCLSLSVSLSLSLSLSVCLSVCLSVSLSLSLSLSLSRLSLLALSLSLSLSLFLSIPPPPVSLLATFLPQ